MELVDYLQYMVKHGGSDLYLTTAAPASVRIEGVLRPIEPTPLKQGKVHELAMDIMSEDQQAEFLKTQELNMAISSHDIGRFRVNVFQQRSETAMVIRNIHIKIPSMEELGVPEMLKQLIMTKRG